VFSQTDLAEGEGVSIGVKIKPGVITDNKPHLEPDGSKLSTSEKIIAGVVGAASLVLLVGSPIVGVLWWRKNGRDSATPAWPGHHAAGRPTGRWCPTTNIPIPVAFSPPRIPVAEAGLSTRQVDPRETAGTIIDLCRKARSVQAPVDDFRVTLVDPESPQLADSPAQPFTACRRDGADLSAPGSGDAHRGRRRQSAPGPPRGFRGPLGQGGPRSRFRSIVFIIITAFGSPGCCCSCFVLPVIITSRNHPETEARAAYGERARCAIRSRVQDLLTTAEADQLSSRRRTSSPSTCPGRSSSNLPSGGRVCADLVAMGGIPDAVPYWYASTTVGIQYRVPDRQPDQRRQPAVRGQQRLRFRRWQLVRWRQCSGGGGGGGGGGGW
jgi:hypothetical protein